MNTDWESVLIKYLELSGDDSTLGELKLEGATTDQIDDCEKRLGLTLPTELCEFYLYSNGLMLEEDKSAEPRFFRQIQKLPEYVDCARSSFSDTHQEYANRYLPFIDWTNGDSCGYMVDSEGQYMTEIFIFLHEHYEYTCKQDINEFLQPFAGSLVNFFNGS